MRACLLLSVLLLCLAGLPARAAVSVGDVLFERQWGTGNTELTLAGVGEFNWLFFQVAVGALYLPAGVSYAQWTPAASKRLELAYLHKVSADDFVASATEGLRDNLSEQQWDALQSRIDTLHRAYRSVAPGDRYALTFVPGLGTELALNGESLVRIPGDDFAEAYFTI